MSGLNNERRALRKTEETLEPPRIHDDVTRDGWDEAAAVRRAADGDESAYEELVAHNRALARRTAVLLGAGDDADDVVKEALVKAYRRLDTFRGESTFRSWLLTIVANETRNLHRSRQRRAGLLARAAAISDSPDERDNAVDAALTGERRAELVAALRQLSPADRDVIVYRYLLDLSEAETAAILDRPRGTVKSRASRALAKLRTQLVVVILVVTAVLVAVTVPPVRSAVADVVATILRLGGIEIRQGQPAPSIPAKPSPLPAQTPAPLASAQAAAKFRIGVPQRLGVPESVIVADPGPDGAPRIVTLLYQGGRIRLDQFDGGLEPMFTKTTAGSTGADWLTAGGRSMLWLRDPHPIEYVDRWGDTREEATRLAGPTLIWEVGEVTYRLEGVTSAEEAMQIALSVS
ncbi:MAG: RNA polymerase sigma factor [Hamadaea sp.]|nr:RNA polymerase sigma factor [Hamadaea sp.]